MTEKKSDEAAVLEKVAAWDEPYAEIGRRLHAIITETAGLQPRLWYGMPGYAKAKNSPVICFFRVDDLMSFGLTEKANLAQADGAADKLIPSAWFLTDLDAHTEARIADIVTSAAGRPRRETT
ncbi:MAG: DUF1801 domain-containing protein [Acidimicrobiia bacterium]